MKTLIPLKAPGAAVPDVSQSGGKMCSVYYDDVNQQGYVIYPDGSIHPLGGVGVVPYYFHLQLQKSVPNNVPNGDFTETFTAIPSVGLPGAYTYSWAVDNYNSLKVNPDTFPTLQPAIAGPTNIQSCQILNSDENIMMTGIVRCVAVHIATGATAVAFAFVWLKNQPLP